MILCAFSHFCSHRKAKFQSAFDLIDRSHQLPICRPRSNFSLSLCFPRFLFIVLCLVLTMRSQSKFTKCWIAIGIFSALPRPNHIQSVYFSIWGRMDDLSMSMYFKVSFIKDFTIGQIFLTVKTRNKKSQFI